MKRSAAVGITIGIILTPIIATILFGISIFNAIKPTSIASIPIFILILLLHILIIIISYRKYNRSSEFTCRLSAPYYDFFLLILQIIFCIFGIILAIINMQNSNGKCAFVSSTVPDNDDEDSDRTYGDDSVQLTSTTQNPSSPFEEDDDMDEGSASCGGVTIVFLFVCIILCLKLFTLPIFKNLTSLTKQVRSSTLHPLTSDPRIRVIGTSALSTHETFNSPSSASGIPRLPSGTFLTPSRTPTQRTTNSNRTATIVAPNENELSPVYLLAVPPPPSYEESIQSTPPAYSHLPSQYHHIS